MYNAKSFKSLSNTPKASTTSRGFTIIELLIVIVIIGILVAITAVSFGGITKQAKESALKSELKRISTSLELHKAKNGTYPTSLATAIPPIANPTNANITYPPLNNGTSSSLTATDTSNPSISLVQTPATTAQSASSPIQTVTKANCSTTRTMVRDARDNSTYWIQKLADGNCWMLTNLAYAGGGTNTSTRQYGYLYNWCAAMGGQSTAACANASTPVTIPTTNICPAGWRLPTSNGGEFTALNAAINSDSTSSDAGLLSNGLFQRSGFWGGAFSEQTGRGLYWSSTTSVASDSYRFNFYSTYVGPAGSGKYYSFAIRCIAQ